jgi:hypothetical protein
MTEATLSYSWRWLIFIGERFPLATHVPMAALLAISNGGLAARATGGSVNWGRLVAAIVLALSFFFRLRCFDEIKDYATDLNVNPTRPLPRGILTLGQVKSAIAALTVLELVLAAVFGWPVLVSHLIAVAYSFLMYREFLIGRFLRPLLTTYAVTHTAVSILLGWSLASLATGIVIWRLPFAVLIFGLANWMLFNIFEFARKTWAREEERPNVDSYSSLFGPWGAAGMTLSQVAVALVILWRMPRSCIPLTALIIVIGLSAALTIFGLLYALGGMPTPAARDVHSPEKSDSAGVGMLDARANDEQHAHARRVSSCGETGSTAPGVSMPPVAKIYRAAAAVYNVAFYAVVAWAVSV